MIYAILIFMLALCQTLNYAIEYDVMKETHPKWFWNRVIHRLHRWLLDGEEIKNV